ncbi:hypothetical protein LPB72_12780 [Hydrogenophaga crassostreae]|uniref:DUF1566 domain-containing protein n=1 Tax=Hydrogenophaga crassostreae TaxID=1763535 RepID=A0A167HNY3_9BURK|nr:hypothetical protein LPB072_21110 [Hydrogenophaga crassostreae]OAD41513.1 hypothetical protein LPB72_12780 [Hydrogenophaga crassostreae]
MLCLLSACGGGQGSESAGSLPATDITLDRLAQGGSAPGAASAGDEAQLAKGAQMSQASLDAAEARARTAELPSTDPVDTEVQLNPGVIAPKSAYASGQVARKAAAVRIPAYRFYNTSTAAHFYTTSETERANVAANLSPPFSFDGPAFSVASDFSAGLSPVHRFYNTQSGVHFYTISETERANLVANLPQFSYEGVAYHASQVAGAGFTPLYRFYVPNKGFHFYTASVSERDSIITNLAATYSYEGIGYYVLTSGWAPPEPFVAKVPHSGVTADQCYKAGSDTRVACSSKDATDLNPQQDGHRVAINALSYSTVNSEPLTSCVKDDVTGLIWEGKTDDGGLRDKDNTYTNLGGGAASDASGYLAAVNASSLCGFSDWRLPTVRELQGIVDYGVNGPAIRSAWFPNTASKFHWTSELVSTNSAEAWLGDLGSGNAAKTQRSASGYAVRLVRGVAPSGIRFTYSSATYPGDAANNVVNDAWTGLAWRRCQEGFSWDGGACTGGISTFSQEGALVRARSRDGWRLPHIKELASLIDRSISSGAHIDATAFPGAEARYQWSSSPFATVGSENIGWGVSLSDAYVAFYFRASGYAVRLVRDSP